MSNIQPKVMTVLARLGTRLSPRGLLFALLFLLIIGYTGYQASNFVRGPKIKLESPRDGLTSHEPILTLAGTASRIAYLSLDDNQIFTDEQGRFQEKLLLARGYNIIKLHAEDRFHRVVEQTLQIMYQ